MRPIALWTGLILAAGGRPSLGHPRPATVHSLEIREPNSVDFLLNGTTIIAAIHAVIVIAITIRVIMRRPDTGVALAWLLIVAMLPYAGAVCYLLIGERRISHRRKRRIANLRVDYKKLSEAAVREGLTNVDWSRRSPAAAGMDRLGKKSVGFPTVRGSSVRIFSDTQEILVSIASDIDAAKTSVLMEFYIWNEGGSADEVLEAVIRAAQRGVSCRVLVDALGARPWWKGRQPQRLRDAKR